MRHPFYAWAAAALIAIAPECLNAAAQTVESVAIYGYCTVCHGAGGNGNGAISAPALAGIEPWYLKEQLKSYRDQRRGRDFATDPSGAEMRTVARELTDAQLADVAHSVDRFKIEAKMPSVQGDAANGKRLYLTHCAACHGTHADGNASLHAPSLARLNDWYIVAAFKKYQSGARGASADNPWANQMHLISKALPGEFPINDVSTYLTAPAGRRR